VKVSGELHTPASFMPGKDPYIHWIEGWFGLWAGLDAVAGKKKSPPCFCWELNIGRPARSLVTILTEFPRVVVKHLLNNLKIQSIRV